MPCADDANGQSFCYGTAKTFGPALAKRDAQLTAPASLQAATAFQKNWQTVSGNGFAKNASHVYPALPNPWQLCLGATVPSSLPFALNPETTDWTRGCVTVPADKAVEVTTDDAGHPSYRLASPNDVKNPTAHIEIVQGTKISKAGLDLALNPFSPQEQGPPYDFCGPYNEPGLCLQKVPDTFQDNPIPKDSLEKVVDNPACGVRRAAGAATGLAVHGVSEWLLRGVVEDDPIVFISLSGLSLGAENTVEGQCAE